MLHCRWRERKFEWDLERAQFVLYLMHQNSLEVKTVSKVQSAMVDKFGEEKTPKPHILRRLIRDRCDFRYRKMTMRFTKYSGPEFKDWQKNTAEVLLSLD